MSELKACSTMLEEKQKWSQKKNPVYVFFELYRWANLNNFLAVQLIFVIYLFYFSSKSIVVKTTQDSHLTEKSRIHAPKKAILKRALPTFILIRPVSILA